MDLDGDGHGDILSGAYSRPGPSMAGLFQVLYGKGDGTFRAAEVLNGADGKPLVIAPHEGQSEKSWTEQICTRPFAVDWDGDGHLDLVVGNATGTFYWFKGEGEGKFRPKSEAIMSGRGHLCVKGFHSDPFVIDWDGDGDLDLLSGSGDGGVQWAENMAGKAGLPELRSFRSLVKPGRRIDPGTPLDESDLVGPVKSTRVWAADVNADGKLDLLIGDSVTFVTPTDGLNAKGLKYKLAAWQDAYNAASNEFSHSADEGERLKIIERINKLHDQRAEFMTEDRTGFVWLYLRKG